MRCRSAASDPPIGWCGKQPRSGVAALTLEVGVHYGRKNEKGRKDGDQDTELGELVGLNVNLADNQVGKTPK